MAANIATVTIRQAITYMKRKKPLQNTMATAAHTGDIPRVYK